MPLIFCSWPMKPRLLRLDTITFTRYVVVRTFDLTFKVSDVCLLCRSSGPFQMFVHQPALVAMISETRCVGHVLTIRLRMYQCQNLFLKIMELVSFFPTLIAFD
jgi:hypothetical protein